RYTASIDDRAYIPVFEFPLGSQTIMIDSDSGYVLWTAIWKSLGNSKADIVKLVDSYDGLEEKIIKIRGGYLKVRTWVPYEVALKLAQRVAFSIRHELVPLFGFVDFSRSLPTFPVLFELPLRSSPFSN
ncbi:transcription regulator HTH, apses-type DNA-binding domain-containing protein, partial [Mrakia frigida]|uniref:transcription regulator HTH, apses-type DNA-binding domain-containing protein n=1 Tax=Mrakia frigida TaxID=29902 RepID=UPI003FCC172B